MTFPIRPKLLTEASLSELEAAAEQRRKEMIAAKAYPAQYNKLLKWAPSPVGRWVVTESGDVEGKTTHHLGTYQGHVVDVLGILSAMGHNHDLTFNIAPPIDSIKPAKKIGSSFKLDIGSGTWDGGHAIRAILITRWLNQVQPEKYENCKIGDHNYFACVSLTADLIGNSSPEPQKARRRTS